MSQSKSGAVVHVLDYNSTAFDEFIRSSELKTPARKLLLDYPTVYVVSASEGETFNVYVGETHSIRARTRQHLTGDLKKDVWRSLSEHPRSRLFVIGHEKFNKSLTLDVENRLMLYMSSVDAVRKIHNRRENPQNDYYTREDLDDAFQSIWKRLRHHDPKLFPAEAVIRQSALFKASPFHKLTSEQKEAKIRIEQAVRDALASEPASGEGSLILVEGAAGSGKTVLLSNIFFDLVEGADESDPFDQQSVDAHLLVNHNEQVTVCRQIAKKLGVLGRKTATSRERVGKPTSFIESRRDRGETVPVEAVLVDEARLLWTRGKQSNKGKFMFDDLLKNSKVVVAVFDPQQVMSTDSYLEEQDVEDLRARAWRRIELTQQMRIDAAPETIAWIRSFIDDGEIHPLPPDQNYDLRIFDSPGRMHDAIRAQASTAEQGLSRLLATFDWPYTSGRKAPDGGPWEVVVPEKDVAESADFRIPWNLQLEYQGPHGKKADLSWAEQPQTIDECGSHFTIQGFDLNYAGVILGPSVGYEDGRVVIRPENSKNTHATHKRTLRDGSKKSVAFDLLRNEVNVLLTRGVHGLYIYAVDPALREALMKAQGS